MLRRTAYTSVVEPLLAHARACYKARELHEVSLRDGLARARVVVVTVVKNEAQRLPAFLEFYRRSGVQHFIVVDNQSTDGLQDYLADQHDVSVYRADGPYGGSRFGVDWTNSLAGRLCRGKWVLFVDVDEHLVHDCENWSTPDVCTWLDSVGKRSLSALLVDMYSERPSRENIISRGQDPLEVCNLFDGFGYDQQFDPSNRTMWVKGGVRARVFFADDPESGPALNKTPLIRWTRCTALIRSTHQAWPKRLNEGGSRPLAALLHFKFTQFSASRMVEARVRDEHTGEYVAYDEALDRALTGPPSRVYRSAGDLIDAAMIHSLRDAVDDGAGPRRQ